MKIHFLLVTIKLPQIDFFEIGNLPQTNPFHTTDFNAKVQKVNEFLPEKRTRKNVKYIR